MLRVDNVMRKHAGRLRPQGSTLLFLPLAHVFGRLIEIGCIESGTVLGHSADVKNLLADLAAFQPTFLLSVPRVFEKVFNSAQMKATAEGKGNGSSTWPPARRSTTARPRTRRCRPDPEAQAHHLRQARLRQAAGRARRQGRVCGLRRRTTR
jgi:long-subunit acyl-CoA synthetase (AMP-forming)